VIDVTRVDYIRIPVDDIKQAKHFYGEILARISDPAGNRILLHHRYKSYEQV
jgi:predicted enzyme related to lactoylglutathione lyase